MRPPPSFQIPWREGRITFNFRSGRNDLFHLTKSSAWYGTPHPPPPPPPPPCICRSMDCDEQTWPTVSKFEHLWKKARVNIVFLSRASFSCLIVLFLWLDGFFMCRLIVSLFSPLVKCSKGVCGGWGGGGPHAQNRTGGSADTWKALQHTTCGCSLLPRGERGWSVAGRLAPPSAVQTNVLRVHHRAFSYKAAVTSNPPKKHLARPAVSSARGGKV